MNRVAAQFWHKHTIKLFYLYVWLHAEITVLNCKPGQLQIVTGLEISILKIYNYHEEYFISWEKNWSTSDFADFKTI